jgi:DNA-binding transcriptional LysR family regulator
MHMRTISQDERAMLQPMEWDDLRYFLAVDRHGTHGAAGRSLRVAATTIGRRLAALESSLGVQLLRRTPDGLVASEAGVRLRAHAERVEAEMLALERSLTGGDQRVAGLVRLTAGDGLALYVLAPRLLALRARHPDLVIELRADNRVLDLSRREADVAVRTFRPRQPSLVVRRLSAFPFGVYGSEPYFARRGRPATARDLARHEWILHDAAQERAPHEVWRRRHAAGAPVALRATTTTLVMAACAAGHGLAALPERIADGDPRLVRVLPRTAELPRSELWAAMHQDLRRNARVAAVFAWLVEVLG